MVIDGITIVLWVISVYFAFSIYCNIRGKHYKFISKDVSLNTTLFFFLGYKAFFEVNDAWVMVLVTLCIIVGIMYFYRNSFVDYSKMKKDFLG